jgi:hypothetical protein
MTGVGHIPVLPGGQKCVACNRLINGEKEGWSVTSKGVYTHYPTCPSRMLTRSSDAVDEFETIVTTSPKKGAR